MLIVQCTEEVDPFQDEETRKEYEEYLDRLEEEYNYYKAQEEFWS